MFPFTNEEVPPGRPFSPRINYCCSLGAKIARMYTRSTICRTCNALSSLGAVVTYVSESNTIKAVSRSVSAYLVLLKPSAKKNLQRRKPNWFLCDDQIPKLLAILLLCFDSWKILLRAARLRVRPMWYDSSLTPTLSHRSNPNQPHPHPLLSRSHGGFLPYRGSKIVDLFSWNCLL